MLLYKVLKAAENNWKPSKNGDDVCWSHYEDRCSTEGDIYCTSINLLRGKAHCQVCFQGGWQANVPCKRQLREKNNFTIHDQGKGVQIDINEKGDASGKIDEGHVVKAYGYNCMRSQYNFTNSSGLRTEDEYNQLLFCENANLREEQYCLKVKDDKSKREQDSDHNNEDNNEPKAVCYEKAGTCILNADKDTLSCTTKEYKKAKDDDSEPMISDPVINTKCKPLKTTIGSLDCTIKIASVDDESIIIKNSVHTWNETKVKATVACSTGKKCASLVSKLCMQDNACAFENGGSSNNNDGGNGGDPSVNDTTNNSQEGDDSNSSSLFLIIIIVILVVLLLSYCGYQNQWHHKVSI